MKRKTLDRAIADARRFIEAAEALQAAVANPTTYESGGHTFSYVPRVGVLRATCTRASMDLTRTLADFRQGR